MTKAFFFALLAAILFAIGTPFAKTLLADLSPLQLSALLYLGSGLGLTLLWAVRKSVSTEKLSSKNFRIRDALWLFAGTLGGGIVAPLCLFYGLNHTPAATAALLLNFEAVATTLLAALLFREVVSRKVWLAVALITLGGILLSVNFHAAWGLAYSSVLVILACVGWGFDNNFTRKISQHDPILIVMIKGLGAGSVMLLLAFGLGSAVPNLAIVFKALCLGAVSYGVSLALLVYAMRHLGAARSSAIFGTGPFFGAAVSVMVRPAEFTWMLVLAAGVMGLGLGVLLKRVE